MTHKRITHRIRTALLSAAPLVTAMISLSSANAAGTLSDFGKDLDRHTSLHHFQVDREKFIGQRFEFNCPAKTVRDKDKGIYGTFSYPANTPICVAAQHAGAIGVEGGPVTLQLNPGRDRYEGSIRNDVESSDLPATGLSIMFLTAQTQSELDQIQEKWAPRLKWDDKFSQTGLANIRLTGQRFVFDCPSAPSNLAGRRVYGTDSYPLNAYVCLSAVHAGALDRSGGLVLLQMDPALDEKFVGSTRNGIESKSGPKSPRSISFPNAGTKSAAATPETVIKVQEGDDAKAILKKGLKKGLGSALD